MIDKLKDINFIIFIDMAGIEWKRFHNSKKYFSNPESHKMHKLEMDISNEEQGLDVIKEEA